MSFYPSLSLYIFLSYSLLSFFLTLFSLSFLLSSLFLSLYPSDFVCMYFLISLCFFLDFSFLDFYLSILLPPLSLPSLCPLSLLSLLSPIFPVSLSLSLSLSFFLYTYWAWTWVANDDVSCRSNAISSIGRLGIVAEASPYK
jgi:hypothetical protein